MTTYYTVKSTWADGMVVDSRPMTFARALDEVKYLTALKTVKVERPVPYGNISAREAELIDEDAERFEAERAA
jgi:hypothetical protein